MRLSTPLVLASLVLAGQLHAGDTQRLWDFAPYSSIRRVAAEKGAPANSQPLDVDPVVLAQALGTLRFMAKKEVTPLFAQGELPALSRSLGAALSQAGPGEDLELMSAASREGSFLAGLYGVTARLFVTDGKLNVIVHDSRLDFFPAYSVDIRMPNLEFGSRTVPSKVALKAAGAEVRRPDWVLLPMQAQPAPIPPVPVQPAQAPKAAPAPAPAALPAPRPSVEERLRGLKRFREQDLITEAEYARQKEELLKEYAKGGADAGH